MTDLEWDYPNFVYNDYDFADPLTGEFSTTRFWEQKVLWAENGDRTPEGAHCIRIDGMHHTAVPGIVKPQGFMGFGGRRLRWKDSAGVVHETNNMWCQGDIPRKFLAQLPDNAEWVPGWWCGGCQKYHLGDHCPKFLVDLLRSKGAT